jgi:hypothetical protein
MRRRPLTDSFRAVAFALALSGLAACAGGDPNSPMAREGNEGSIQEEAAEDVLMDSDR